MVQCLQNVLRPRDSPWACKAEGVTQGGLSASVSRTPGCDMCTQSGLRAAARVLGRGLWAGGASPVEGETGGQLVSRGLGVGEAHQPQASRPGLCFLWAGHRPPQPQLAPLHSGPFPP